MTKHSEFSVMNSNYFLDWSNRPKPFKVYKDLSSLPLPIDFPHPTLNAVTAISNLSSNDKSLNNKNQIPSPLSSSKDISKIITLSDLSSLLFYSYGITRVMRFNSVDYYMRAASATGALYPIEIYVVAKGLGAELDAGVYHFNPGEFSLSAIRKGDYRSLLGSIAGNNTDITTSPISLIFTSYAWRNAWKYQLRSYRHWFWDAGVIVANLLAVTGSMQLYTRLIMGFLDDQSNRFLGLEDQKEASILIAAIDVDALKDKVNQEQSLQEKILDSFAPKVYPLSLEEIDYPEIWKAYNSSKLLDNAQVSGWINPQRKAEVDELDKKDNPSLGTLRQYTLPKSSMDDNGIDIGNSILKRGSTRQFSRLPIPFLTLSNILLNSTRGIPMDYKNDSNSLIDLYLVVNAVDGLEKGGYFFNSRNNSIDLLKDRLSRNISGHLCLDQSLFADASAVIFIMTDLKHVLDILGNRGYRATQMEAGITAGKIYLLSYAHGLGASGSTFYDNEVIEFFSPHAKQKETLIAIGVGIPSYRSKPGRVLPVRLTREQMIGAYSTFS
ncbi:SagB/ThcOx family dehydrogenase [Candidatus Nitrosocosmicus arcticus]|nr:SagB/ThcOx family dehydrogenase [Candidatus Nitrosocosmicus arcticus]